MDNKAYLDEIAVKGKKKFSTGPFLTPVTLKLIIVGAIAVIVMVIVGNMLGNKTEDVTTIHASVYARVYSFLDNNGPIEEYYERLKESDLRTYSSSLVASLTTLKSKMENSSLGFEDIDSVPGEVADENEAEMAEYMTALETAYLNGVLDVSFASNTAYQLSVLLSLENQARLKTNDADYAEALDNSINDLTQLQKKFKSYSDTH